jgi:hypothetical protein
MKGMKKKLDEAYDSGKVGLSVPAEQGNPSVLCKWKRERGVAATGKYVDGKFKVVLWHQIK